MAAVCLTTLGVAACGGDKKSDKAGTTQPAGGGKAIVKDPASASKGTITVGSKNFTEEFILGEIYAQTLEAQGFKVRRRLNLGSEQVAYKAVKGGDVDMYPEYTGTALTSFFNVKVPDVPKDSQAAYELAKTDYAKNGITALAPTPYDNTFVITATKAMDAKLGHPKTVSELFSKNPKLSISGFPECRQRADCLIGIRKVYGFKGKFVSSNGKFSDIDGGQSDLTFGFGTDPQILQTDKYVTYKDDKNLFPPYNISLGIRNSTAKKIGPKAVQALESVQSDMTIPVMRELNRRVDLDKQQPKDVAAAYLKESGYLK